MTGLSERSGMSEDDWAQHAPWRVGSKVGRTVYAMRGGNSQDDLLIGMFDTPELARRAVSDHNRTGGSDD
jgi:hypothetical protein